MDISTAVSPNISQDVALTEMNDTSFNTRRDLVTPDLYFIILKSQLALRTIICFGGMAGNTVNIVTFLRMGLEDSVTIAFFNLAVSDFFVLASIMTSTGASFCQMLERDFRIHFRFDPFFVFAGVTALDRAFIFSTAFITTFLALQRCLCVVKPLHFKGAFTRYRSCVVMATIWVFCLTVGVTFFNYHEFKKETVPGTNSSVFVMLLRPGRKYILAFINIAIKLTLKPMCVSCVFVSLVVMANALRKSVQFRKATSTSSSTSVDDINPNRKGPPGIDSGKADNTKASSSKLNSTSSSSSKERQVILQVSIVSTVFLISNIPAVTMAIATAVEPQFELFQTFHYTFWACFEMRFTVECINSAVNFFIYYRYNTKFRNLCFRRKK